MNKKGEELNGTKQQKIDILSLLPEQLEKEIAAMGAPKFRAKQIFRQLHIKRVFDFSDMTELSKQFQAELKERFYINLPKIEKRLDSCADDTVKYLYMLEDGEKIETVFMSYTYGNSVCISSQAGCRMGCTFCASTLTGLCRNLTPSEMLSEVYLAAKDAEEHGEKIASLVLMGIGEPMDNYDNVLRFIRLIIP